MYVTFKIERNNISQFLFIKFVMFCQHLLNILNLTNVIHVFPFFFRT
jgi:hypothetical protein